MIDTAKDELYLMLSALANTGVPIWTQTKYVLGLRENEAALLCPQGVIDILNANIRDITRYTGTYSASSGTASNISDGDPTTACTQVTPGGNASVVLESAQSINTIGVLPHASGLWTLQFQYSTDSGVTWATGATGTYNVVAGRWFWVDIDGAPATVNWRVLASSSTVLNLRELAFCKILTEVPL